MDNSICIVTPTTGSPVLFDNINSVQNLDVPEGWKIKHLIIIDGIEHKKPVSEILKKFPNEEIETSFLLLPENIGGTGFVSHRAYAASPFLVNETWITHLDQDNFVEKNHITSFVNLLSENKIDWAFCKRNIVDPSGKFVCVDNCESLGPDESTCLSPSDFLVDTNCYFLNREKVAVKLSPTWYVKARQPGCLEADRAVLQVLKKHFHNYKCTETYSMNYRVAGRSDSVQAEFFLRGNKMKTSLKNNDIITIGA